MTRLLITTGPESCGKTTLATAVSEQLQAPLVREVARDFLDERFRNLGHYRYQQSDLLTIAQQQYALEQQALAQGSPYLVCDTDLLVLMIWSEVKFGSVDPAITELFARSLATTARTYLLCDYQVPWQSDPQREDPDNREELFERYVSKLDHYQLDYYMMRGSVAERMHQVSALLNPVAGCPCCAD